jgi:phospholipase/carboxylesterase
MTISKVALTHVLREPEHQTDEKPPLVVLIHGWGSNEANMLGLADYVDDRYLVASLRAPIELGPDSYGWYMLSGEPGRLRHDDEDALAARAMVVHTIDDLVAAYDADPKRVVLMGFSQGAIISLGVALNRPDMVAGAVIMSGLLLPAFERDAMPNDELKGLPILEIHGLWDQIIPIENGRAARDFLASKPVDLTYREYPMAHEVSLDSLLEIEKWLKQRI